MIHLKNLREDAWGLSLSIWSNFQMNFMAFSNSLWVDTGRWSKIKWNMCHKVTFIKLTTGFRSSLKVNHVKMTRTDSLHENPRMLRRQDFCMRHILQLKFVQPVQSWQQCEFSRAAWTSEPQHFSLFISFSSQLLPLCRSVYYAFAVSDNIRCIQTPKGSKLAFQTARWHQHLSLLTVIHEKAPWLFWDQPPSWSMLQPQKTSAQAKCVPFSFCSKMLRP